MQRDIFSPFPLLLPCLPVITTACKSNTFINMEYSPVFTAFPDRPTTQSRRTVNRNFLTFFRDSFSLTTWILLGAVFQGLLVLVLPYRNLAIVGPAVCLLVFRMLVTLLQTFDVVKHDYTSGVIPGRTVPVFADDKGIRHGPGSRQVCAIMLSARSNHPMGTFAPHFDKVGEYFTEMLTDLSNRATETGFLGGSAWQSTERDDNNEQMSFLYFESPEKLHAFAHDAIHTKAMLWWQKNIPNVKHIGLMHEVFSCASGAWEGIYVNYHPTGLGACSTEAEVIGDDGRPRKMWVNPLVHGGGKLRYSKARMGNLAVDKKNEWVAFEETAVLEKAGY